ncbi:MAG: fatty acid desaturase [Sphingobacteriales bacterium]|nr:MAG: fatty acid desaturase [Sphingobacteriales bacterium]TAF81753.1 MAG: fatty acid desaturase [Sphingobacteriales bacterium]
MQNLTKTPLYKGLYIAIAVIVLWFVAIIVLMNYPINFLSPWAYVFILVQMHLYTGLFITAHDAMHGIVMPQKPKINFIIGQLCTLLYALFPFNTLKSKHFKHHNFVHTAKDPDYYEGGFFIWYFSFIKQYITWWQIIFMALVFNILKIYIQQPNLLLFWVLPSLLSTLQLFYFGTYRPHKGQHNNIYQSTSQAKNHFVAFFTCYFFGYHYEHHHSPATPWWKLWKIKNKQVYTHQ